MRQKLVAGNWKMNGSRASVNALVESLQSQLVAPPCEVLVCPPALFIAEVQAILDGTSAIQVGAQNLSEHPQGAYTGEISADMLADYGCSHVLVGHSERRSLFGEDDTAVANKFKAAQQYGLIPVLCVGETLEQRDADKTLDVVSDQIDAVIKVAGIDAFRQAVIAYEPVWAIGTGRTATPEQAQQVHQHIRSQMATHSSTIADSIRILYGGSVKGDNAAELFDQPDIDGALVGGASLKAEEFVKICQAAS